MAECIYTLITEDTVRNAKARALEALDKLTNGNAIKALSIAAEYNEFSNILKEIEERKAANT